VSLPSTQRVYRLHAVTSQGGVMQVVDPRVPLLGAPDRIPVLVGLNQAVMRGQVPIYNLGGSNLTWSAQTTTPSLIQLEATGGTITTGGAIPFRVIVSQTGAYSAYVNVNAGTAGSKQVRIDITVVNVVHSAYFPATMR